MTDPELLGIMLALFLTLHMERKPEFAFDLEGTLVDLERLHQQAFEEVAERLGIQFGQNEFAKFVGAGDAAISKEIARLGKLARFKLNPKEIEAAKQTVYRDMLHSHTIVPREGVPEYLESSLLVVGGDLVLASVTPDDYAEKILAASHLKPFFKYVLTESSVNKKKPDPEIYLKAADLVGVDNAAMLVHEDSPVGVAAAKAAGSPAAAFPVHKKLNFKPKPDALYMTWKNLDPREVIDKIFRAKQDGKIHKR